MNVWSTVVHVLYVSHIHTIYIMYICDPLGVTILALLERNSRVPRVVEKNQSELCHTTINSM